MPLHPLPEVGERRRYQRVRINLLGRFMLGNKLEYPCQVLNMSPGGVALMTPVGSEVGERVVAYVDHIGRIEGKVARTFDGGFAMVINATARKRDMMANQLTWLANRTTLGLPEDRIHERVAPTSPMSKIELTDGRTYECRIKDMSIGGAAVVIDVRPAIGSPVTLGKMRATVVRHFDEGIALEFSDVQSARFLEDHFGVRSGHSAEEFEAEFKKISSAAG